MNRIPIKAFSHTHVLLEWVEGKARFPSPIFLGTGVGGEDPPISQHNVEVDLVESQNTKDFAMFSQGARNKFSQGRHAFRFRRGAAVEQKCNQNKRDQC